MPQKIDEMFVLSFRGDLQGLNRSIREANSRIGSLENSLNKRAARINTAFQAITRSIRSALIPAALLIFSRTIITALTSPIRYFREFETSLVSVGKVADLRGAALASLGDKVERLGTSSLPIANKQLLAITETAARLGVRGESNLVKFTSAVAGLTLATDITAEAGASNLAGLLALSKTAVSDVDRVSAALVDLGNNANATEAEIIEFALNIGKHTAAARVSVQDLLALGTTFAELRLRVESSGSAIGRAILEFNEIIRGRTTKLGLLSELTGTDVGGLTDLLQEDQFEILRRFIIGLKDVAESGGDVGQTLKDIGIQSNRSIAAFKSLAARSDFLQKNITLANEAYEENSAAAREVARQSETLDARIGVLGNSWQRLLRASDGAGGFFKGVVNSFNDLISDNTLNDFVGLLDTAIELEGRIAGGVPRRGGGLERLQTLLKETREELAGFAEEEITQFMQRLKIQAEDLAESLEVAKVAYGDLPARKPGVAGRYTKIGRRP